MDVFVLVLIRVSPWVKFIVVSTLDHCSLELTLCILRSLLDHFGTFKERMLREGKRERVKRERYKEKMERERDKKERKREKGRNKREKRESKGQKVLWLG